MNCYVGQLTTDFRGIFCLYTAGKVFYNERRNKQLDKNEKFKGFDAAEPFSVCIGNGRPGEYAESAGNHTGT